MYQLVSCGLSEYKKVNEFSGLIIENRLAPKGSDCLTFVERKSKRGRKYDLLHDIKHLKLLF